MSSLFNLFKSREFVQCEEKIKRNIRDDKMFRLLDNDMTNPCNNKLIEKDVTKLIKQYKSQGYHIKSIKDTIYESNGNETIISVGVLIYKN